MPRTAIVTGITGQDGAYLSALLLARDYRVFGTYRRTSSMNFWRIDSLGIRNHENLELVEFDITDAGNCFNLVATAKPDEIYNLGAKARRRLACRVSSEIADRVTSEERC